MKHLRALSSIIATKLPLGVALAANLLVSTVPLLHAWAHHDEGHAWTHQDEPHAPVHESVGSAADDEHPPVLDDDWRLVKRASMDLEFTAPVSFSPGEAPTVIEIVDLVVLVMESRGPPGRAAARSPPA
jgi:hypothetical protein